MPATSMNGDSHSRSGSRLKWCHWSTAGGWGYAYFPYVSRLVRNVDLPTLSHTGRFHRSWGDFGGIKPDAALKYECCAVLAQGFTGGVGDQMLPDGTLDPEAYRLIGDVYRHIEACEPLVEGARHVREIAVVIDPTRGDDPGPAGLGVVRVLQELQMQFDLVTADAALDGYRVVVLPEATALDETLAGALRRFLDAGGGVIACLAADATAASVAALPELGVEIVEPSPFSTVYLRPGEVLAEGMPLNDPVLYRGGPRVRALPDAKTLCGVVEPYFERRWDHFCSHAQTPPKALAKFAAVVQHRRAITFAFPLFSVYAEHASLPLRRLFANALSRLLPDPVVRIQGPAHVEAVAATRPGVTLVHLLSFLSSRRAPGLDLIEDPFPLLATPVTVRCDRRPLRVYLAPMDKELDWTHQDGQVRTNVNVPDGHTILIIEHAA